ncbi:MAG: hypothetical protein Kow0032_19200 [Methyloligellaceae bacterium]
MRRCGPLRQTGMAKARNQNSESREGSEVAEEAKAARHATGHKKRWGWKTATAGPKRHDRYGIQLIHLTQRESPLAKQAYILL